jgi:hypothetical protein
MHAALSACSLEGTASRCSHACCVVSCQYGATCSTALRTLCDVPTYLVHVTADPWSCSAFIDASQSTVGLQCSGHTRPTSRPATSRAHACGLQRAQPMHAGPPGMCGTSNMLSKRLTSRLHSSPGDVVRLKSLDSIGSWLSRCCKHTMGCLSDVVRATAALLVCTAACPLPLCCWCAAAPLLPRCCPSPPCTCSASSLCAHACVPAGTPTASDCLNVLRCR